MANFNEDGLKKKLADLNMSQQSIQTMSLWLIHHKKHAHNIVNIWYKELVKAETSRKLVFMYLANDVIQNSKRKGPEYNKEFAHRLPKAFKHLSSIKLEEKAIRGIKRLIEIWGERGVFDPELIKDFKKKIGQQKLGISTNGSEKRTSPETESYKPKKIRKRESTPEDSIEPISIPETYSPSEDIELKPKAEVQIKTPTRSDSTVPPKPSPEPEELIKALQSLENAATADAEIRKKIAGLPASISDLSGLSKLKDEGEGQQLQNQVDEALEILNCYNKRLSEEMEARKAVAKLLHEYISHQKDLLSHTEETLEMHRAKYSKVQKVRQELKAHLQNLPDISKLPSIGSGLGPLPSAGDLFT